MTVALDTHRRERIRRLERENTHLRANREQLERVLGLALVCATAGKPCGPLDLLAVLESVAEEDSA